MTTSTFANLFIHSLGLKGHDLSSMIIGANHDHLTDRVKQSHLKVLARDGLYGALVNALLFIADGL